MSGNTFGRIFRVTTAGESHGLGNIVIIDGVPPGLAIEITDLQTDLDRRRPGQSKITTQRKEPDTPQIISGVFEGKSTGTPICVLISNQDQRSHDYDDIKDKYRPGHADYTYDAKYGLRDYRGGGRASARETVARVAAGAIARKLLYQTHQVRITAYVKQIGDIIAQIDEPERITVNQVDANPVRCPDPISAEAMINLIDSVRSEKDSIGGIAEIVATNVPPGWGEPVFDKLKADLAKAMLSLPAVTGIEFGYGFNVATARGSENNDTFTTNSAGKVITTTNRHGGMLGGITTGMPIIFRCAVKPTSSLPREQHTVDRYGQQTTITTKGRHDPCLLPRFIPVAEAMTAIVLADHMLRNDSMSCLK